MTTYPQGVSLGLHHARSAFFTTVRSTVLHRGQSPLFTRPKAVEKLDFEFWILKLNIRLASSQCSKLMFVGERANGACLGVQGGRINEKPPGEAEDGSHTLKPALARVTYESMGLKPHVNR
ncbi:MAG: hypothetical protein IJ503_00085 [Akkermansia sp.]|nr:hypothetical protein [Akkermansia sp.]